MNDDDKEREASWKAAVAPLVTAYAERGRAALETMEGVEPLAVWNDKVKDYNAVSRGLEKEPGDIQLLAKQEKLRGEIDDITDWINGKLREQQADSRKYSIEEMRQLAAERIKAATKQQTRERER